MKRHILTHATLNTNCEHCTLLNLFWTFFLNRFFFCIRCKNCFVFVFPYTYTATTGLSDFIDCKLALGASTANKHNQPILHIIFMFSCCGWLQMLEPFFHSHLALRCPLYPSRMGHVVLTSSCDRTLSQCLSAARHLSLLIHTQTHRSERARAHTHTIKHNRIELRLKHAHSIWLSEIVFCQCDSFTSSTTTTDSINYLWWIVPLLRCTAIKLNHLTNNRCY